MAQKLAQLINNGVGTTVSRLIIIFVWPLVTLVGGFAGKTWTDNIDLRLAYISVQIGEATAVARDNQVRLNKLENRTERLDERLMAHEARLERLEGKSR